MAEILTESFCERCGTRYTFQTAAPRKGRLSRLRIAGKGLRNYVLEDGSSLEDAFAEARGEEERAISGQQLEAFHKTFNFCLSCRQYTCANCWNPTENRCLSCAPDLSREIMPAPFPTLVGAQVEPELDAERIALSQLAWPEIDLARPEDGHEPEVAAEAVAAPVQWPPAETPWVEAVGAHGLEAERAEETPEGEAPTSSVAAPEAIEAAPEAIEAAVEAAPEAIEAAPEAVEAAPEAIEAAPEAELIAPEAIEAAPEAIEAAPEAVAAVPVEAPEAVEEPEAVAAVPVEAPVAIEEPEAVAAAAAYEVAPEPARPSLAEAYPGPLPTEPDARAAAAAARTSALLGRFRPGQSLDAALEAFERGEEIPAPEVEAAYAPVAPEPVAAEAMAAEAMAQEAAPVVETPEPEVAAAAEPAPAAELEPEPVAAEPEPEPPAEPVAAEPVAATPEPGTPAATAPPEAAPPPRRDDRVEVPVWRIVAPDTQQPTAPEPPPAWPSVPLPPPGSPPAWPSAVWASEPPPAAVRAREQMWAESSRDVLGRANTGVQSCVSCGLPLSATARFCRRCGARQS